MITRVSGTGAMANTEKAFLSRRMVLSGGGALLVAAGAAGWVFKSRASYAGQAISVQVAHKAAQSGEVLLVDIRRPDEWKRTGVPEGAHRIDMRRKDFLKVLDDLTGGDTSKPVALICARGVRSAWLSNELSGAGYANVINVPEGMLGSGSGPGWLKLNLPVIAFEG